MLSIIAGLPGDARGSAFVWPDALDEAGHLTQAIDVQQANGGWCFRVGWAVVVGPACGDGDVTAIGQPDDEVWVSAAPNPDNLNALTS